MARTFRMALAVTASLAVTLSACSTPSDERTGTTGATGPTSATSTVKAPKDGGCITDFDPDTDYYPNKSTISDATNFTLRYHNSYQVLTVKQPYPGGRPESYVLVHCGAPAPEFSGELAHAQQVTVPIKSLYSGSTTQLGMLAELDQIGVLTGVANTDDVVNSTIRGRINDGDVVEYASGDQVNVESVIAADPDVVLTHGLDDPAYPKLRSAGIAVVADAEWLETSPLGRAEWVKVIAALTATEKKATEIYSQLRNAYQVAADEAAGVPHVQVLAGALYQGSWSMPAGASYAGRLILDAGGDYPWAGDTHTGSLQLSFESVYAKAGQAPVWLVNDDWETLADALADDNRYGELAAVRDSRVWSADKAIGPGGGNDYWERGVARPDLVLSDLIAILHPGLVPDHQFEFYRRVPRG